MRDDQPEPAECIGTSGPKCTEVSHPPQPPPTYSPSVLRRTTENTTAKGLAVNQIPKINAKPLRKNVQRHSPDRLLRKPLVFDGVRVSAERHKGRLMVRFETPNHDR
jgi:hypothetical protein